MIDSSLIFIASILLISAGVLTIIMRRTYRDNGKQSHASVDEADVSLHDEAGADESGTPAAIADNRSGHDRRKRRAPGFPLTDYAGRLVAYERRMRERRCLFDTGFA
jgi:hypothetical protein